MKDVATAAAAEFTEGILDRVPDTVIPYIIMIVIISFIYLFFLRFVQRSAEKMFEKSVEQVRIGYDNIIKSQQQTIEMYAKKDLERKEERK